jgi:hypothetical protein
MGDREKNGKSSKNQIVGTRNYASWAKAIWASF